MSESGRHGGSGRRILTRSAGLAGLATVLMTAAACGSSQGQTSASPSPASSPAAAVQRDRGSPRWLPTASLSGTGKATTDPFGIVPDVLQWRVRYHCTGPTIRIETRPAPQNGKPLVDDSCPGDKEAYATRTGQFRLTVDTAGPWTATVEQQVDTPVDEPPSPEMQSGVAKVVSRGTFHDVDRMGHGAVTLYSLPGGKLQLRLENFEIPINTDLFVWTEQATGLTTSPQMQAAAHVVVAPLTSTSGNQNYSIPADDPAGQIKSIVIWCQVQQFAYVATDLQP